MVLRFALRLVACASALLVDRGETYSILQDSERQKLAKLAEVGSETEGGE